MSQVRLMLKAGLETNESARLSFPCKPFDGRSYPFAQLNWNKFQIRPNSRIIEIWIVPSINSRSTAITRPPASGREILNAQIPQL